MHTIDFEPYPIEPNTLHFLSPGQGHFWQIDRPLEGMFIRFTEDFFLSSSLTPDQRSNLDFFHRISGSPLCRLTPDQSENIRQLFQDIEEEFSSDAFDRPEAMWFYLRIQLLPAFSCLI